jgi:hypothetical protein
MYVPYMILAINSDYFRKHHCTLLAFVMNVWCVFREVGTEVLNVNEMNFRLQRVN